MATTRLLSEEDFCCPICCDKYKDPVILTCSHSACKGCLRKFWKTKKCKECPVCRAKSTSYSLPPNLALRHLCEAFQQDGGQGATVGSEGQGATVGSEGQGATVGSEGLCSLHNEKFKLFCLEDKQPVCLECRDSKTHKNHNFSPIHETAQEHKDDLKIKIKPLKNKLANFRNAKKMCDETAQHIQVQAQHTEKQIKQEFEKLHQFLHDEEAARIAALREEEEQKSQMMKEKIEKMSREISSLSFHLKVIKQTLAADDITFLQSQGTLINVAKHLGNLKFRVWEKMKDLVQYTPVTLDPNTAHPQLILSDDLTSVRHSDQVQQLPDNPERFDKLSNVLGSEGLESGTHCWEVEIGDGHFWGLGVRTESSQRKGQFSSSSGVWSVSHADGKYSADSPSQPHTLLKLKQKPQRIRVELDWDKGKLSFSDLHGNTPLYTFTDTFTETVFPLFYGRISLRILPENITSISEFTLVSFLCGLWLFCKGDGAGISPQLKFVLYIDVCSASNSEHIILYRSFSYQIYRIAGHVLYYL
ncbi:hypothetical protein ACEWY4_022794 [Coilia grayii]|uniref:Zinc-binding protein A33-like n=1 Tax=Coilia grayii TaxID=363190 RepID=A0ABD1J2T6_9TELE